MTLHLLSFAAPALVVALLVALAGRLLFPRNTRWWRSVGLNFVAGAGVLAGGLVVYGRDGKMGTYVAMVVAVATLQWLTSRGWKA